ncbi:hypothetical protein IRT45_19500 [Nocardia sp. BSTN01]|uniref:hypothetical protein n=1 Tax=Nocardia sp. BSTN01 TaxID=2783665 RepID=UPI00188DD85F|nr:hypothetical protein [Nocardia sp. BSTN01]MBF4999337.1 hypothetical protein [Nocardia sp. BSTN01]
MSTKHGAPQVNPIVQAAADRVRKSKRRKAKDLPANWERPGQTGLFDESEVKQ